MFTVRRLVTLEESSVVGGPLSVDAVLDLVATPLSASVRVLAMISFAGAAFGMTVPWRFRIAFSLLMGGVVASGETFASQDYLLVLVCEAAYGAAIGTATGLLLVGLKLAGEMVDDRLRLSEMSASVSDNPELASGPCLRMLGQLAVAVVLFGCAESEFPVLSGLLEGFRRVPPARAVEALVEWRSVVLVLGTALELALRTAAPILAVVAVVDWADAVFKRVQPLGLSAVLASAVKPCLGLMVLAATFGGALTSVSNVVEACLAGISGSR